MDPEIAYTLDGSHTLYLKELDEYYHSINGAIDESNHVYISAGYNYCRAVSPVIFEVGFGTGLNALLTALQSAVQLRHTTYYSIEKYPISNSLTDTLNYPSILGNEAQSLFNSIIDSEWEQTTYINSYFNLHKINKDLNAFTPELSADIVYFDAFAPSKQPELWNLNVLSKMAAMLEPGGIFITYSAKGEVQRNLKSLGFSITLIPGARGKREMIRAIKI